jgi:anthranilate phosphoribosyltransferase
VSDSAGRFAPFVATLGRGPGRSRALTREEAREAFGMVLRGEPDPHQVGAFLMLLRYRGEDADEVSGLVEAARGSFTAPVAATADLDWPSYGAGRTRGVPWFLLAALALAHAGVRVLMHGTNDFTAGVPVSAGLAALGMTPAADPADAAARLARDRFAYLPLEALSPAMTRLLRLRELFGLRSPVNTVARLLDPAAARAGVDGVFHPPYIAVHLGVAERLGRPRLAVLKGGGGEAERMPAKPMPVSLLDAIGGRSEPVLPAWPGVDAKPAREDDPGALAALWRGESAAGEATVLGTIALGLLALGRAATPEAADAAAVEVWRSRASAAD